MRDPSASTRVGMTALGRAIRGRGCSISMPIAKVERRRQAGALGRRFGKRRSLGLFVAGLRHQGRALSKPPLLHEQFVRDNAQAIDRRGFYSKNDRPESNRTASLTPCERKL